VNANAEDRASGRNADATAGASLEKTELALGFIPLTDCAPLAIAQEKGFFRRYGLRVRLSREPSWANIRDKICCGILDGAQILAGMPLAASLGAEAFHQPMIAALSLNLNGDAITVSNALYQRMAEIDPATMARRPLRAASLKKVIEADKAEGRPPLRFAMVYPSSSHNYLLRYWLASSGIDPDKDIRLGVVPPPSMTAYLASGRIDGYCVGEPWNSLAVERNVGRVLIASCEIWNNHPEKVFGVTREWAQAHPRTLQATIMALIEACRWLDEPGNRLEAARILAAREYVNAPEAVLAAGLMDRFRYGPGEAPKSLPDFHVFHRYAANFPWLSHAEWILTQMLRWGQLKGQVDVRRAAAAVYRPDLYRRAAAGLGLACPPCDRKVEGLHDQPWLLASSTESFTLGPDRFFDGGLFDSVGYASPSCAPASMLPQAAAMPEDKRRAPRPARPSPGGKQIS
jgi:nitrate/nitrite transport system substrate-binding protein